MIYVSLDGYHKNQHPSKMKVLIVCSHSLTIFDKSIFKNRHLCTYNIKSKIMISSLL